MPSSAVVDDADPQLRHDCVGPPSSRIAAPGFWSLNILYRQWSKPSFCTSNCRGIEVAVIYPSAQRPGQDLIFSKLQAELANPGADQGQMGVDLSPTDHSSHDTKTLPPTLASTSFTLTSAQDESEDAEIPKTEIFTFFTLPLELRLKIYAYLLPARRHTIVTQIPCNGYFYNTSSIPAYSAQTFYPFGRTAASAANPHSNLTTYKVLNSNFRHEFPAPSIHVEILRTCKRVRVEAEPVLYGSPETGFDFGTYLEALPAFLGDRSALARQSIKTLRIAREIPASLEPTEWKEKVRDEKWEKTCAYISSSLPNLRTLDVVLWAKSGSLAGFPSSTSTSTSILNPPPTNGPPTPPYEDDEDDVQDLAVLKAREAALRQKWREWEWTRELLQLPELKKTRITWCGFNSRKVGHGADAFDF
jgi:hypothetical protein